MIDYKMRRKERLADMETAERILENNEEKAGRSSMSAYSCGR